MKSFILAAALVLTSSMATADIIRPGNIETKTYTGKKAQRMYESEGGVRVPGSSLRTSYSTYRVWRADDGLTQTVCEKISYKVPKDRKPYYRCTVQTSLDGQELPEFNPPRRLG